MPLTSCFCKPTCPVLMGPHTIDCEIVRYKSFKTMQHYRIQQTKYGNKQHNTWLNINVWQYAAVIILGNSYKIQLFYGQLEVHYKVLDLQKRRFTSTLVSRTLIKRCFCFALCAFVTQKSRGNHRKYRFRSISNHFTWHGVLVLIALQFFEFPFMIWKWMSLQYWIFSGILQCFEDIYIFPQLGFVSNSWR